MFKIIKCNAIYHIDSPCEYSTAIGEPVINVIRRNKKGKRKLDEIHQDRLRDRHRDSL